MLGNCDTEAIEESHSEADAYTQKDEGVVEREICESTAGILKDAIGTKSLIGAFYLLEYWEEDTPHDRTPKSF